MMGQLLHQHLFVSMLGLACILTLPGHLLRAERHQLPHYTSENVWIHVQHIKGSALGSHVRQHYLNYPSDL